MGICMPSTYLFDPTMIIWETCLSIMSLFNNLFGEIEHEFTDLRLKWLWIFSFHWVRTISIITRGDDSFFSTIVIYSITLLLLFPKTKQTSWFKLYFPSQVHVWMRSLKFALGFAFCVSIRKRTRKGKRKAKTRMILKTIFKQVRAFWTSNLPMW